MIKILHHLIVLSTAMALHSCFLVKIRVPVKHVAIKDTIKVYHFIVSGTYKNVDTTLLNAYKKESKRAYDWISREASWHGKKLLFNEYWPVNLDSNLEHTFVYKLPSKKMSVLFRKKNFRVIARKKTKKEKQLTKTLDWRHDLFDSIAHSLKDTLLAGKIRQNYTPKGDPLDKNELFVLHLPKINTRKILGFYTNKSVFVGHNKSRTIAHESIHHLGAPDLYIHKYWFGKRRRIVKSELREEIMNSTFLKNSNCNNSYISSYTAYCIGWKPRPEELYEPLLKQNLMAKIDFFLSLLLLSF